MERFDQDLQPSDGRRAGRATLKTDREAAELRQALEDAKSREGALRSAACTALNRLRDIKAHLQDGHRVNTTAGQDPGSPAPLETQANNDVGNGRSNYRRLRAARAVLDEQRQAVEDVTSDIAKTLGC